MKNPIFVGMKLPEVNHVDPLEKRLPGLSSHSIGIVKVRLNREIGIYCLHTCLGSKYYLGQSR